jgi:hypothetical protein
MIRPSQQLLVLGIVLWMNLAAQAEIANGGARAGWRSFELPRSGTRIDYPAGIFSAAGASEKGAGERFQSPDGGATLSVYAQPKSAGETPAGYLQNNLQVDPFLIQYKRITPAFFAISMERGGMIYYSRCNFSAGNAGAVHCFDLAYPQREKRAWDPIVTRISLSLRPLEG